MCGAALQGECVCGCVGVGGGGGALAIMAYKGRLRPKGVPFLSDPEEG